jgi:predicted N-acetyltransferase YhbS
VEIRSETPEDVDAIRAVTIAAFRDVPHSSQTEAAIVDALRAAGALTISLVAVDEGEVVGHVAFSPVTIGSGAAGRWLGLGPVSVRPDRQRLGIGAALIQAGLARLREIGAEGCVVLGDPTYYGRFGFESDGRLRYPDVPTEYLQRIVFAGAGVEGEVEYHPGFDAS